MTDARTTYLAGREARARDVRQAEARARSIGTARVVVAIAAVAFVVALVWGPLGQGAWWGVVAAVVVFAGLVLVHARVHAASERAAAALRFHDRGLARLDDRWSELPATGERFASADHPYSDDLDVFGPSSLFQRLDRAETRFGEERLAQWLTGASEPVELRVVRERQVAVKDLSPRTEFRERFSAAGSLASEDKPDPAPFLAWAEGAAPFESAGVWAVVAWILPLLALAGALASVFVRAPAWAWAAPVVAELAILGATARYVGPIAGAVSSREGAFGRFGEMLALVAGTPFEAPLLRAIQSKLRASGAEATLEMARLERILAFLDARNNEVWRFFIGPVLLWDLHCVVALERWRIRAGTHARAWLEAIGDMEALASLAGLAFEQPDYVFPEIVEEPRFDSTALGHPLIAPGKRVANDVALRAPGTALVITGSNMSGKSTLLRAIGVNAVLALAGGPVCARRLVIGPVRVAASMRVRDSLAEGVSRFYAEVRKLKAVIDRARSGRIPATLFLLDEVLHGTNSRERLIGARAIVRELVACGAMGGVSTHDLALGDMEKELPGAVVNVHFEEQVAGDRMTFDYKLRPGVVHSSNALRIMRMVGIDVVTVEGG
jgi:ABC-type multidrug transport system fused ATPase/permease subunit